MRQICVFLLSMPQPGENRYRQSNAKHWCEFCKVFIYNNKACISRHEQTPVHHSKVEVFINAAAHQRPAVVSPVSEPSSKRSSASSKRLYEFKRADDEFCTIDEQQPEPVEWNVTDATSNFENSQATSGNRFETKLDAATSIQSDLNLSSQNTELSAIKTTTEKEPVKIELARPAKKAARGPLAAAAFEAED